MVNRWLGMAAIVLGGLFLMSPPAALAATGGAGGVAGASPQVTVPPPPGGGAPMTCNPWTYIWHEDNGNVGAGGGINCSADNPEYTDYAFTTIQGSDQRIDPSAGPVEEVELIAWGSLACVKTIGYYIEGEAWSDYGYSGEHGLGLHDTSPAFC